MDRFETKIKYGIAAACAPAEVYSAGKGTNELNTTGINNLAKDAYSTEFSDLLASYLGFIGVVIVRLFDISYQAVVNLDSILSTGGATDIVYKFSKNKVLTDFIFLDDYTKKLKSKLIVGRSLSSVVPQNIHSNDFIDYLSSLVLEICTDEVDVETYSITFENKLPDDVEMRDLPAVCRPKEDRHPSDMPAIPDPFTGKPKKMRPPSYIDIIRVLISDYGLCSVGDCDTLVVYDRKTKHYEAGMNAVISVAVNNIYTYIDTKMQKEISNYLRVKGAVPHVEALPINYVVMNNCVLDVSSRKSDGTFRCYELSPSWVSQHYYPVDYNPGADTTFVENTLHGGIACGRDDVYSNLIEIGAFILYQKASGYIFMLHNEDCLGDAANGKSTYLDLCRALCRDRYTSLDIQECGGASGKYNTADLENALCNIGEDLSNMMAGTEALSKVKALVTGGETSSQEKFVQGSRNIKSIAQHIYACNMMPRFSTDDGFNRRFHLVPMNAHFSPDSPNYIPNMSELLLKNEENIQAFAKLSLNKLNSMFENNSFKPTITPESLAMAAEFKVDNSPVLQWIQDRGYTQDSICYRGYQHPVLDASDYTPDELYEVGVGVMRIQRSELTNSKILETTCVLGAPDYFMDYKIWCSYRGHTPKTPAQFKKELQSVMNIRRQSVDVEGKKEQSKIGFLGKRENAEKSSTKQFYRMLDGDEYRFSTETKDEKKYFIELENIWMRLSSVDRDIHKKYIEDNSFDMPAWMN